MILLLTNDPFPTSIALRRLLVAKGLVTYLGGGLVQVVTPDTVVTLSEEDAEPLL